MTRKDYVMLSDCIRRARMQILDRPTGNASMLTGANAVAMALCDELARENSRFDRDRFIRDCGIVA